MSNKQKPCKWFDSGGYTGKLGVCKHPLLVHMAAEDPAMGRILAQCHGCPCHEPEPKEVGPVFISAEQVMKHYGVPPDTCPKCGCQLWDPFGFGVRMKHDIEGCLGPAQPEDSG